jgi:hypothetical protein
MARKALVALLAVACVGIVVSYQLTRPSRAASDPKVFVPSPKAFRVLPKGLQVTLADAYWLYTVQYYGEHLETDNRFDSLPQIVDLVVTLSPRFHQAYITGAFALIDAGRPDLSYELLQRGFEQFPDDWHFPHYLGFFIYTFASDKKAGARVAAQWYLKASKLPGAPAWTGRLAANLLAKGGNLHRSLLLWAEIYADGDKYSKQRAIDELDTLLSKDPAQRDAQLEQLRGDVPAKVLDDLESALNA